MSAGSKPDFAAELVAAGKRERASDAAKARALDVAVAAVRRSNAAANDAAGEAVASAVDVMAEHDAKDTTDTKHAAPQSERSDATWALAKERRKLRVMSVLASALFAAAAGIGGLYIKNQGDERAAAAAAGAVELANAQSQLASLNAQLRAQNASVDAAMTALANARDEQSRLLAQAELAAAQNALQQTKASFMRAAKSAGSSKATAACTCSHSDPLCGCL